MARDHSCRDSIATFAAFHQICKNAKQLGSGFYVSLYSSVQRYGGPEEGGWYYPYRTLLCTERFPTEEAADAALAKIRTMASEMSAESARVHYRAMVDSCEWLEARGLEADFLPEPDGPESYIAIVEETPGMKEQTDRPHYE